MVKNILILKEKNDKKRINAYIKINGKYISLFKNLNTDNIQDSLIPKNEIPIIDDLEFLLSDTYYVYFTMSEPFSEKYKNYRYTELNYPKQMSLLYCIQYIMNLYILVIKLSNKQY